MSHAVRFQYGIEIVIVLVVAILPVLVVRGSAAIGIVPIGVVVVVVAVVVPAPATDPPQIAQTHYGETIPILTLTPPSPPGVPRSRLRTHRGDYGVREALTSVSESVSQQVETQRRPLRTDGVMHRIGSLVHLHLGAGGERVGR